MHFYFSVKVYALFLHASLLLKCETADSICVVAIEGAIHFSSVCNFGCTHFFYFTGEMQNEKKNFVGDTRCSDVIYNDPDEQF